MVRPTFDAYLATLSRLTPHVDPTNVSPGGLEIRRAVDSLRSLPSVDLPAVAAWIGANPRWVHVLGLTVGLSQEKLKNSLQHAFGTSNWTVVANRDPSGLASYLDQEFGLVTSLDLQRNVSFDFGDILIARAGTRASAIRAAVSGRRIEDQIEGIAIDLGLQCETRTRFIGRGNQTAPCDLAIPAAANAAIVVAAKGFDSTGSKLTDAVREIEEMANVRLSSQFVVAVIDGIGWKSRRSDLRRLYELWETNLIDGMYTLATLDDFRADLQHQARLRGLLP